MDNNSYHNRPCRQNNPVNITIQNHSTSPTVTFKEWLITLLLMMIPIVNLILPFILGFFGDVKESQRNFFRAYIIMLMIVLQIYIIIGILFFCFIFSSIQNMSDMTNIL